MGQKITARELAAAKVNKAKIGGGVSVVANTITIAAAGGISGTSTLTDNTVFVSTTQDLSINSLGKRKPGPPRTSQRLITYMFMNRVWSWMLPPAIIIHTER